MTSTDFPLRGHEPRGGFSDEPSPVFSWTTLWWDFNPLTTPPLGLKSFWSQCLRLTCLRIIESAGCSSCSGLTSQWFRGHYGEVRAWHLYTGQERLDLPEKHPVFELDALFPVSVSLYLRHFCLCICRHALPLSAEGAAFRTRDLDGCEYPDLILKSSIINSSSNCIRVFFSLCRKNKTSLQQACPSKAWPNCEQGYGLFLTRRLYFAACSHRAESSPCPTFSSLPSICTQHTPQAAPVSPSVFFCFTCRPSPHPLIPTHPPVSPCAQSKGTSSAQPSPGA